MADAQFVVDIAAAMPAGEATIAQLDQLTAKLMGGGKGAEQFSQALVKVSGALDTAKAANVAATDALAQGEAEYGRLERAAMQAAKAAEKAALKGVVPPEVAANADKAAAAVNAYADTLRGLEGDAAKAASEEDHLAKTLGNVKKLSGHVDKSIAGQAERFGKLQGSLSAVGGPLGELGSKLVAPVKGFSELSGSIGSANAAAVLGAVGFAAVAAAIVVVAAAAVAGVAAVASWAVGLADSARSAGLAREAYAAMHPELAGVQDQMAGLSRELQLGDATIQGLASSLQEAKVSAADMPDALRAAALAEKALGQGGGAEFVKQLKAGKKAVGALAAETERKLGGIVQDQLRSLPALSERAKAGIGDIFGGLNIDPVLSGLETLSGLFDQNTAAGQTMKFLFESVFQPLIDQADKAAVVVEAFAIGFLIGLTKVYIALKPAIKAVSEFFGFDDSSLSDTLAIATKAGEYLVPVFLVMAGIFGAVAIAVGVAIVAIVAIQAAIYAMIAAVIYAGVQLVQGLIGAWNAVSDFLGSINLVEIGANIIHGLANGITGAAGFVKDAVANAVNGAIASAKGLLGIHSPSTVFAAIGENTGEGFAVGVDDTADRAQSALGALVEPPAPTSAAGTAAAQGAPKAGGGAAPNLAGSTFNFYGVKDGDDAERRFGELLTRLIEGDATQIGEAVPA